jgi:hypothetical protein
LLSLAYSRQTLADLAQVAGTLHAIGSLLGGVERREQDADQQRDDADHDQQLHKGETPCVATILCVMATLLSYGRRRSKEPIDKKKEWMSAFECAPITITAVDSLLKTSARQTFARRRTPPDRRFFLQV